jgi:hypothetical protein
MRAAVATFVVLMSECPGSDAGLDVSGTGTGTVPLREEQS